MAKPAGSCPVCGSQETASPEHVTVKIGMRVGGEKVQASITVPSGPVGARRMLPVLQSLTDVMVDQAVREVEAKGEHISCRKGCGACCRQLVPITPVEAHRLRDLVNSLPEPRRTHVHARFAEARRRLAEAGMLEKLEHGLAGEPLRPFGLEYFRQRIACPFLEEESCSIYPDRPMACREYLVTSPAEHCAEPTPEHVKCVPLAGKVSNAVARVDQPPSVRSIPWVPLILAPSWAESHPEKPAERPGPDWLRGVFERLTGEEIP
jgi:Fe-S-cluster containining protein